MAGKKKFRIKHPGIEKRAAAKSGRSVHAQLEADKHSNDPAKERRGNLGLMFERAAAKKHAISHGAKHARDKAEKKKAKSGY